MTLCNITFFSQNNLEYDVLIWDFWILGNGMKDLHNDMKKDIVQKFQYDSTCNLSIFTVIGGKWGVIISLNW